MDLVAFFFVPHEQDGPLHARIFAARVFRNEERMAVHANHRDLIRVVGERHPTAALLANGFHDAFGRDRFALKCGRALHDCGDRRFVRDRDRIAEFRDIGRVRCARCRCRRRSDRIFSVRLRIGRSFFGMTRAERDRDEQENRGR